jgi:phosphotransferase system enzyme I (PtsP)
MALLGIGIRRLSITPASVGPVKAMVRSLDIAALSDLCTELLAGGVANLREPLAQWADEQGVELN